MPARSSLLPARPRRWLELLNPNIQAGVPERRNSQLVCDSPPVCERSWWLYTSLCFLFLGERSKPCSFGPWWCSRAGEWLGAAVGEWAPLLPPRSCPFVQPAKKKVSFNLATKAHCPPSAVSEICLETTSSFKKKKNRFKAFLPEVKSLGCVQSAKKKLCKKVPTVTLPPEPWSWIWTDLHT